MLKDLIAEYCYTKSNTLNSNCSVKNWWVKRGIEHVYNEIIDSTRSIGDTTWRQKIWHVEHNTYTIPSCDHCQNAVSWNNNDNCYHKFCSCKCAQNSDNTVQKRERTNIHKYGVKTTLLNEQVKDKRSETMLSRYNTENYTNREKASTTIKNKYGVDNVFQLDEIQDKSKQTCLIKYGSEYHNQRNYTLDTSLILNSKELFSNYVTGLSKSQVAHNLGVNPTTIGEYSKKYDADDLFAYKKSKWELEIKQYLTELNIAFEHNTRQVITPYELDFYLPEYNIAIEVNGIYWHSEIAGKKDKNYHYNKWQQCKEKGINLYSYFDDELLYSIDIIKSKIKYITQGHSNVIGARLCTIDFITNYTTEYEFLSRHHIQGPSSARNSTIGAYYNNNLIAVLSWIKRKNYLEITRYACDNKSSYPGLFSKLMKYMIRKLDYTGEIVSFSNNGHSNGNVYKTCGFDQTKILGPAYWYTRDYKTRENRQNYMKGKIKNKFNIDVSNNTEWGLMQSLGFDRIWDSGKIKWSLYVKD